MKNIGLIDDKDISRRAFMLKLNLELEKSFPEWRVVDSKPFKEIKTYHQWILENEISVLIIDERLDEEKLDDGSYVRYFGSDLVKKLRMFLKDFPIYCITNIEITEQLKKALNYFNLTLSRKSFDDDIDNYLNLFIRSGISFYTEFKNELSRLGELSVLIASGKATQDDLKELQSIQTRLVIPHFSEDLSSRETYLIELEKQIGAIKDMQEKLVNYLNR
ncbi:MAG: hypothetical protein DRJ10_09985 [Bacteroidetes bacterium]|nr:MAG: hypothetical protein DRJ10_09985 [Bacteroidota bacterium]